MGKILLGWPIVSDEATLSDGDWLSTLPLTNVQDARVSRVARSNGLGLANTLLISDMLSSRHIKIAALSRHNLQADAQWRIEASDTSDFSVLLHTSGWINVWPEQWPVNLLPVGHPNGSTRRLTSAQIATLNPHRDAVYVVPGDVAARYWRVSIDDATNTDGYVEVGRLILASGVPPSYNFATGAEFGFIDNTSVNTSLSGTRFYETRPRGRSLAFSLQSLPNDEAVAVLRDVVEHLGRDGQVYVVTDDADTYNLQRRSFLANFRDLSPVQYAASLYSTVPVVLDEVL